MRPRFGQLGSAASTQLPERARDDLPHLFVGITLELSQSRDGVRLAKLAEDPRGLPANTG
jgi:hypothetical protein